MKRIKQQVLKPIKSIWRGDYPGSKASAKSDICTIRKPINWWLSRGGRGSKREAQLRACSFSGLCVETRLPEQSTRTTNQNKKRKLEIQTGGGGWGSILWVKTLPKAQRTRGLSSYHKFTNLDQITISESWLSVNLKISTKHQHQHQASESWPRFNFITSTKHQQQNTDQTSASNLAWTSTSKYLPNLVLKVSTKVKLYDQTSASKSATRSSSLTSATVTTSTSFE